MGVDELINMVCTTIASPNRGHGNWREVWGAHAFMGNWVMGKNVSLTCSHPL